MAAKELLYKIGVVLIGRNEGERLSVCLKSVTELAAQIVYVDSGSTDDSVILALSMGAHVVELDMAMPFTAARARNAGFKRLLQLQPNAEYVQFLDGDCELVQGWLEKAVSFLDQNDEVAVVCGHRRERYPEQSVFNRLCDMEWDTPVGETRACGGDALMRVSVLIGVEGYREDLIAGEEPELCVRLRKNGWKIWRIDEGMALHDAAITQFSQWWKRSQRGGYAFAEGAFLHGASPERHWVKESLSAWFWGGGIPVLALNVGFMNGMAGWAVLLIYPLQVGRLALRGRYMLKDNWLRAFFLVLGKFPELLGQLQFLRNRLIGSKSKLIEYK
jgi:glycosyltransferase involved in cell wall biosynthesis